MVAVAAVQLDARSIDRADDALEEALEAIGSAADHGADIAVLPECTWPAYLLGTDHAATWARLPRPDDVIARFADAARTRGLVLVVGLALPVGDGIANAAVVIERDGAVLDVVHKRFLWDVDARWFTPGQVSRVIASSVGRLGVMICADGRMPEIARELAVRGAELLVDPTAWVTAGADPTTWTNPQAVHMLPTRARENGIWAVAANKVGLERDLVAYCGLSLVAAPDGTVAARARSEGADLAIAEADLAPARPPVVRRPELYGLLTAATDALPVVRVGAEALVPSAASRRLAATTRDLDESDLLLLEAAGIALLVTGSPTVRDLTAGATVRRVDDDHAELVLPGVGVVATWARTHGDAAPGTTIGPVVATPAGNVGVVVGVDGLATEPMRVLMLAGADVIVWFADDLDVAGVAATRAAENRVHLVVTTSLGAPTSTRILDPNGNPLADVGAFDRTVSAVIALDDARRKEMAPGTDVVAGRQPSCYLALTDA
jgi:predicted amidohydrolase